jgi:signal transduction histidine kinase
MRESGLDVALDATGVADGIPPGVGLAAYRVVQESLVNALKHAPGARVLVRLRLVSQALEILVSDNGGIGSSANQHLIGGHGLIGMRERVSLYGGRIEARHIDGGSRVEASIPIEAGS